MVRPSDRDRARPDPASRCARVNVELTRPGDSYSFSSLYHEGFRERIPDACLRTRWDQNSPRCGRSAGAVF